ASESLDMVVRPSYHHTSPTSPFEMSDSCTPRVLVAAGNLLGESPVWDGYAEALWWVDIHGRTLHRWTERHGHGVWPAPEQIGCIGLSGDARLVAGTRQGFVRLDPTTGEREPLAQPLAGRRDMRFNDGRADRNGNFWSATVSE